MKCPHCLVEFHDKWSNVNLFQHGNKEDATDPDGFWGIRVCRCAGCDHLIVKLSQKRAFGSPHNTAIETIVHPRGIARAPIPSEVPSDLAKDYREACLVLKDSPNASTH